MARNLPEGELSWEWVRRVQTDFTTWLSDNGVSLHDASRKLGRGFSPSVLSTFCSLDSSKRYIGNRDRIVRGINRFLEQQARTKEAPRPSEWIETDVARRILTVIGETVKARAIGLIYSDAGRGKTMTLEAARDIYAGSILMRVIRGCRAARPFALVLSRELRLVTTGRMLDLQLRLIDALKGTDRVLMIDEAHQLSLDAIEVIRDIHDTCGIPVILAGTKRINDKCSDDHEFFGQLTSRVAYRYDVIEQLESGADNPRPLHSVKEIRQMFESDKVRFTDDGIVTLGHIANLGGFGGLRLCRQIVYAVAAISKDKPADSRMVLKVLRRMHGIVHPGRVEQAIKDSRVKVA